MKKLRYSLLFFLSLICVKVVAQNTGAVDELLYREAEQERLREQSADEMRRLEQERDRLARRLSETLDQIAVLLSQNTSQEMMTKINYQEIFHYLGNGQIARCRITFGEQPGEIFIQKGDVKIKFSFLPQNESLAPVASFTRGEQGERLLQIHQPGYDSQNITQEGAMEAMIRFRSTTDHRVGSVVHAIFTGNRVEDELFGYRSSLRVETVACLL